jgi:transposase
MTQDELAQVSREELIQMLLAEHAQLEAAQKLLAELKLEIEALRMKLEKNKKPPTNSSNSSQPPSRDQKSNRPKDQRKRHRHGPPDFHEKHGRKLVAKPDHIVEIKPHVCGHCQADLAKEVGKLVNMNQITELPEAKAEVIEVRQYATECPCCGQEQVGEPPAGLEIERSFGARLEGTVVYYRQQQHMSYVRTQAALRELHGVEISQGGIDQIMQRGGKAAIVQTRQLQTEIQHSPVVYCDETGGRVDGQNWYQWVFSSASAVLHVIRFDRSVDVIQEVMRRNVVDVWVSDGYAAQMKAPARYHQLCMAHQLRQLQAVIDQSPDSFWPRAMQALFRSAIHLHHHRSQLSPPEYQAKIRRIEHICHWLLERPLEQSDARRLKKRYIKHRNCLFVFLYRSDVDPTNNISERYLRPSVIHRKVIGCFRSSWGAQAYTAIASVTATAALRGISAFHAIQSLFGTPALPLTI